MTLNWSHCAKCISHYGTWCSTFAGWRGKIVIIFIDLVLQIALSNRKSIISAFRINQIKNGIVCSNFFKFIFFSFCVCKYIGTINLQCLASNIERKWQFCRNKNQFQLNTTTINLLCFFFGGNKKKFLFCSLFKTNKQSLLIIPNQQHVSP